MQDNPRSLTMMMTVGGILLLFVLGAILAVSITEALMTTTADDAIAVTTATETGQGATTAPATEEAAAAAEEVGAAIVALDSVPVTDQLIGAFTNGTCIACHIIPGIPGAVGQIGPNLSNIGAVAGARVPGQSALEYLHMSVVDPMDFIAPECPTGPCIAGAMPPGLEQLVSDEELNLMINYLAGLEEGG